MPADGDDGEGQHDHLDADAERDGNLRRHQRAAERPERRADRECDQKHPLDIDAEGGGHLAVVDHRAQEPADAAVAQRELRDDGDHHRAEDEADVVIRDDEIADDDVAGGEQRLIGEQRARSPDDDQHLLEDQEGRVGHEHDGDLVAVVEMAQQPALQDEADHRADRDGRQRHHQEAERDRQAPVEIDADRRRRGIGAEGVASAMRDVQDLHDPEDQAEADRDDEQLRA